MPTLPQSNINLSNMVFGDQPSKTWRINQDSRRIEGEADGYEAVRQAVEIILNIERFRWQIFSPYSGMQWRGLIGQDVGYVAVELKRRMSDAFSVDRRIIGIGAFDYSANGDSLRVDVTVSTVYGDVRNFVEVDLS